MSQVVSNRKQECYKNIFLKLNNPKGFKNPVWKTFYNGRKIPVIPPLLTNNKIVSNFKTKADHSNIFFASHCTQLDNNSTILGNQTYVTDNKLSSLQLEDNDIIKIIRSLDTSKGHGHDDISIRTLKICDSAIIKPLSIIFRNSISQNTFPTYVEEIKYMPYS